MLFCNTIVRTRLKNEKEKKEKMSHFYKSFRGKIYVDFSVDLVFPCKF